MSRRVHEVTTGNPVTVEKLTSLAEAARVMRDASIGDVLVVDEGRLRGILTDRDIVVRAIAETPPIPPCMPCAVLSRSPSDPATTSTTLST